MTPLFLQDALVGIRNKEGNLQGGVLRKILENVETLTGEHYKVFDHFPPQRKEANDYSQYPLCYATLGDGEDESESSSQDVVIVLIARDESTNYDGYRDVMNGIQRIREYFNKNPYVDDGELPNSKGARFEVQKPIRWTAPQNEETFPLYVGGILLTFTIPSIAYESPYI